MSYVTDFEPSPLVSSMRTYSHSRTPKVTASTGDLLAELQQLGELYDDEYSENSRIISESTDSIAYLYNEWRSKCEVAMEEWRDAVRVRQEVMTSAEDREIMAQMAVELHTLDEKHQALLLQAEKGQQKVAHLQTRKLKYDKELEMVNEQRSKIAKHRTEDLQTLMYIRRLLKAVSKATVHKKSDPNVIDGFIVKPDSSSVVPFRCDDSKSSYENVNQVWDIILQ